MQRRIRGFTLIELVVAIAVITVLVAVALPTYQSAMVKNRRATAQAYLADVAQRQQQHLTDARAFAATTAELGSAPPDDVARFYDIAFTVSPSLPPAYTATATPRAGSAQAKDGAIGITSNGTKFPAGKW